jgi:hypothetical protein
MASIYKLSGENWLYLAEKNKNKKIIDRIVIY